MDVILSRLQAYVDICVHCAESDGEICRWLKELSEKTVQSSGVSPDNYMSMTYEEEALLLHKEAMHPTCKLQVSFRELLDEVEERLDSDVVIPVYSKELQRLFKRMKKIEKRLERLPDAIETVFRAPVQAIIERCLTHIDYFYLQNGLDIYPLIQNVHGNHKREYLLHENYIEDIVDTLLEKKQEIAIEDILMATGDLRELGNITSPTLMSPNTPTKENDEITDNVVRALFDPNIDKKHTVDECVEYLANIRVLMFLQAVALSFDCLVDSPIMEKMEKDNFIKTGLALEQNTVFPWMDDIAYEISAEVRKRKDDEHALNVYISELLYNFYGISLALFPKDDSFSPVELIVVQGLAHTYRRYSFESFCALFNKAKEKASAAYDKADNGYYETIRTLMLNEFFDETIDNNADDVLANLCNLTSCYTLFESALEAALLLNGIEHDYKYYENISNVRLMQSVSEASLSGLLDMTPAAIIKLANDLRHNILIEMIPGESFNEYYKRQSHGAYLPIKELNPKEDKEEDDFFQRKPGPVEKPVLEPSDPPGDIPMSGVDEVDVLGYYYFVGSDYYDYYNDLNKIKFRRLCHSMANDKALTREDKENWIIRVLQTIDAAYGVSDYSKRTDEIAINCMARELSVILECAFMQVSEPICVKRIAMENDLNTIFSSTIETDPEKHPLDDDIKETRMLDIMGEIGGNVARFERKMCRECELKRCPYRYIMSKGIEVCIPDEYPEENIKDIHAYDMDNDSSENNVKDKVRFRQLDPSMAEALPYFKALYPTYVDENFNWKKGVALHTNYNAYWVAKIISTKFPGITMAMVGEVLGINNIRTYGSIATSHSSYRTQICNYFTEASLQLPNLD